MKTLTDLIEFNKEGRLSEFVATMFGGELGHAYPNKDSDRIIVFSSESVTPGIDPIRQLVTEHLNELGFKVDAAKMQGKSSFDFFVISEEADNPKVFYAITTNYPFPGPGQGRAAIRLTSEIVR